MKLATFTDLSNVGRLGLHVAIAPWLSWDRERRVAFAIADRTMGRLGGLQDRVTRGLTAMLHATHGRDEIAALARANIRERWADRELVWLWRTAWSARRRGALARAVEITGLDHLRATLAHGRGGLLLDARLGNHVLARAALRQAGFPICQVHARDHGGELTWLGQHGLRRLHRFLARRAAQEIVEIAPDSLGYLRTLTARLRRNALVTVSALGRFGDKFMLVDGLGTTLAVPTGTPSLARATGAALLPFFTFTEAERTHIVIEAPLAPPGAGDAGLIAWANDYVALLDRYVRRRPTQWSWWSDLPTAETLPAAARRLDANGAPRR